MFGDDEAIRSDKDLAEDYRQGMERQDRLIAEYQRDNTALLVERNKILSDMPTAHKRTCHRCGNVAWHADKVTPYVLCRKCGSQDTRKINP
jgi:ribosomal protein S27AE